MKDITIGADPEFCILQSNPIRSDAFIARHNSLIDALMSDGTNGNPLCNNLMGADGSGKPFEIRPNPSLDPLEVVENIGTILRESAASDHMFFTHKWEAGCWVKGWPIGGHIHFGTLDGVNGTCAVDASIATLTLDDYLGLILAIIEGEEGWKRRSEGHYGVPGSYRVNNHGFEYRTPGSWLVSPYVASACLCLGKTVVCELINNSKFKFNRHSMYESGYRSLISNNQRSIMIDTFPSVWEDITRMKLYEKYKPYIDVLHFLVSNNLTWKPKCGMKAAWGITKTTIPAPKSPSMDNIWEQYNKKVNT
jgi:hypothetical protein